MRKLNIAIDGYAGCGKSTLAKDLARSLGFTFVDTGALYRGITYAVLDAEVSIDAAAVEAFLKQAQPRLDFHSDDNQLLLNGKDIEEAIRTDARIADHVSPVAAIPAVRDYLDGAQKAFVRQGGIVMEGRDIGTVVMPDADLKVFVTASIEERVNRRFKQLQDSGKVITREEVAKNLLDRDAKDAGREVAPLRKAADAIALDTSQFDRVQQLEVCLALVRPYLDPASYFRFMP